MRRVRIEHDGAPAWGELRDGEIAARLGRLARSRGVTWLAPVEPDARSSPCT